MTLNSNYSAFNPVNYLDPEYWESLRPAPQTGGASSAESKETNARLSAGTKDQPAHEPQDVYTSEPLETTGSECQKPSTAQSSALSVPTHSAGVEMGGRSVPNSKIASDTSFESTSKIGQLGDSVRKNPDFSRLNNQTKLQVLSRVSEHANDSFALNNLNTLFATPGFNELNPGHQKEMLEVWDNYPADTDATRRLTDTVDAPNFQSLSDVDKSRAIRDTPAFPDEASIGSEIDLAKAGRGVEQIQAMYSKPPAVTAAVQQEIDTLLDPNAAVGDKETILKRYLVRRIKPGTGPARGRMVSVPNWNTLPSGLREAMVTTAINHGDDIALFNQSGGLRKHILTEKLEKSPISQHDFDDMTQALRQATLDELLEAHELARTSGEVDSVSAKLNELHDLGKLYNGADKFSHISNIETLERAQIESRMDELYADPEVQEHLNDVIRKSVDDSLHEIGHRKIKRSSIGRVAMSERRRNPDLPPKTNEQLVQEQSDYLLGNDFSERLRLVKDPKALIDKEATRLAMIAGEESAIYRDTLESLQDTMIEQAGLNFLSENPEKVAGILGAAFDTKAAQDWQEAYGSSAEIQAAIDLFRSELPNLQDELSTVFRGLPENPSNNQVMQALSRFAIESRPKGLVGAGFQVLSASLAVSSGAQALEIFDDPKARASLGLSLTKTAAESAKVAVAQGSKLVSSSDELVALLGKSPSEILTMGTKASRSLGVLGSVAGFVSSSLDVASSVEEGDKLGIGMNATQLALSGVGVGASVASLAGFAAAGPVGIAAGVAGLFVWGIHEAVKYDRELKEFRDLSKEYGYGSRTISSVVSGFGYTGDY